jgi:hypothetical protein
MSADNRLSQLLAAELGTIYLLREKKAVFDDVLCPLINARRSPFRCRRGNKDLSPRGMPLHTERLYNLED